MATARRAHGFLKGKDNTVLVPCPCSDVFSTLSRSVRAVTPWCPPLGSRRAGAGAIIPNIPLPSRQLAGKMEQLAPAPPAEGAVLR